MNLGSISEGVQNEAITRLEASPHLEGFRARRRGVGDQEHARHNGEAEIAAPGLHPMVDFLLPLPVLPQKATAAICSG